MPTISTGDAALLRQFPQAVRRYLSIAPRDTVFAARVSSGTIQRDAVSNGVVAIPYNSVTTGAYSAVITGMTLDIGTTAGGAEIGKVRVRSANTTQILIGETLLASLAAGNYLTVRREFRPWLVKPRRFDDYADAAYPTSFTEYHDYDVVYSNQNAAIQPKANITMSGYTLAKPAGFVDGGQTYRTVSLSGANSVTLAAGAALTAWLWEIADGTLTAGALNFALITVRFPVGFRYVTLTVTDSNGATQTMRLPIWVHDSTHMPITQFTVTSDETRADAGREMRFEVFGNADVSVIAEGSTICYWEDAEFGGTATAAPTGYRGQFLGWALRDATLLKLYRSRYALDVAGAAGVLDRLGGFAQTLIDPGKTPTQWHEMQHLTLDRAAHYALRSYTNVLTLINFYTSGVGDVAQTIDLSKRSVWGQISDLVRGYCGTAGCDSLGGLWLRKHLSAYSAAEQAGFTADITLSNADWTDAQGLSFPDEKSETVGLVEANGSLFDGTTTIPLASKAHGAQGVQRVTMPFQVVSSQTQLNDLTGRTLGRLNNRRKSITLKLLGNLDAIEPAWNEPIAISGAGANVRGLTLSDARFLVTRVSVDHSNERGKPAKTITWTLEGATTGDAGITLDVPEKVTSTPPPPPNSSGKKVKPLLLSPGTGTIAALNDDGYVYVTHSFNAVKPTWTRYSLASLGMTGLLHDFVPDPFSPLYLGTGTTVNGWLVSERQIGRLADIFGATPTYTAQFTFATTITVFSGQRVIETERSVQNFVVVSSYYPTLGTKAIVSTDGVHWGTETTLTSGHPSFYLSPGLAVSGKAANVAYSAAITGTSFQGYKYSGGSWAAISNPNISGSGLPGWIHIPWANNDDSLVFYGATTPDADFAGVYRAVGTTRTDITPTTGGHTYTCRFPRSVDTCALNNNRVVLCGYNDPAGATNRNAVFASKDQGKTWSVIYGPVNTTAIDYMSVRCAGDDEDVFYLFGGDGRIAYSADFGATLKDKRGNLGTFAGIDTFVNLCGG